MKIKLSFLMITKDAEELLGKSLASVKGLVDEIVIIDDFSKDNTLGIAKKYGARIFQNNEEDLGKQKGYGLKKVSNDWVLVLDSDEILSKELSNEIKSKIQSKIQKLSGYSIPFQNHFLGRPLHYGGENYKKLILFNKKKVKIEPAMVHEKFEVTNGEVGELKSKVFHYSYRTIPQMLRKFTDYSLREAKQKSKKYEKSSLEKIFLYPAHMFWARFVKDKGYKDGIFRIPLDLGFAYMELLTYVLLLCKNQK